MSREALLAKTRQIALAIAESDAVKEYWQAREKMEQNSRAQQLFEELKLKTNSLLILQQQLPAMHPKVMLAQLGVNEVEEQLQRIPVAIQYRTAQGEVNEMMQLVTSTLLNRLHDALPVERGPRQGCGQGHGGQGCSCHQ